MTILWIMLMLHVQPTMRLHVTLKLYTQDGNYPYQAIHDFELPVAMPIPADYTGPDAYGYYAYSSNDAFYDQIPVYNWVEVRRDWNSDKCSL